MEIYQLYINLLHNPFVIRNLRELEQYYLKEGMLREGEAFGQLIETRLQNDANNNSHSGKKSQGQDSSNIRITERN